MKRGARTRAARKRMAKRPAKKAVAKRTARKAGAKRAPAKKSARSSTRKSVTKRKTLAKAATRRGPLVLVRRRVRAKAAAAAPPPFGAITGASAKHLALFEVIRARVTLHASLQGLVAAGTEQRVEGSRWTLRETLLHLIHSDREFLAALEPALHGVMPDWADETDEARDRRNDAGVAPLRGLDYGDALRRMQAGRQELMSALESLPEEPVTMWGREHALGRIVAGISRHDLHHANQIKHWRTRDV